MKPRKLYYATICCLLGLFAIQTACTNGGTQVSDNQEAVEEEDSIVDQAIIDNPEYALLLIDSLEDKQVITEHKANYYRGQAHFKLGQDLTAELYYKRALTDDEIYREHPSLYYFVCDQLSTILTNKGDQDGAITIATEAYARIQEDTTQMGHYWTATLLHDIGYSQMQLGRHEEAEKSFTQAWNTLKHLASENPSYDNLYAWARITYNIIDAYTSTEQFQQAESWLGQGEEAINKMISSPECSAKTAEEFIGGFSTHKALVYIKTGKRAEAEKAYQHFLSTNYSKTSNGLIEHSEYLEQAERWEELAKLTPKVDSVVQSWEIPLSLYYLKTYMKPYLMGYLKSGRKEEALKMAERMALAIDSVDSYERHHNAAELAIMYETQEKEKQIAEQQSQLQSQRYLSFLIAVVIILVSLIIIGYLRLRSAASLAAKNRELKQKNDELTLANKRAEESSRMKTDFIQQISHEIRTPLNILSGFTQVLTTSGMELKEAEKADINQRINENTHRITELVNKMLELSDIHSKTVIERSDLVSSVQIAAQATEESDIHQATHITFHLEYDEKADKTIRTNFMSATRALALLLNNAAKFTKEGSVELRIERDKAASSIVFSVTDTGIGVPPYEAERIFQEFTQLDQYYDGTGIGLTVARSIARRLGGDIRLDPTYNNGARFLFSLPDEQ